jgi:hypothetical protein
MAWRQHCSISKSLVSPRFSHELGVCLCGCCSQLCPHREMIDFASSPFVLNQSSFFEDLTVPLLVSVLNSESTAG